MFRKVLVAAPTARAKHYCFKQWLENVMNFKYPNFDILLFCNDNDGGDYAEELNGIFREMYGDDDRFHAISSIILNDMKEVPDSLIERMCISHNDVRNAVLSNDYSHVFWNETDVMAPHDTIENLMFHQKRVIGALYYRDEGKDRKLMVQKHIKIAPKNLLSVNLEPGEDAYFIDGSVKKCSAVGLGAVLIERNVLEIIKFRTEKGVHKHPDSYFDEDCFRNKIDIWADTSIICKHHNKVWGLYGTDFY